MMRLFKRGFTFVLGAQRDSKSRRIRVMPEPNYLNRHLGRDFLILGAGPTLKTHINAIKIFAEKRNLVSIGTNNTYELFYSDYVGFTNRYRFSQFGLGVKTGARSALLSIHFSDDAIARFCTAPHDLVSWKQTSEPRDCSINSRGVIAHYGSVGSLMILVAYVMGANNIFIAGMDGAPPEGKLTSESLHFRDIPYKVHLSEAQQAEKYGYWLKGVLPITYAAIQNWARETGRREFISLTPTNYGEYFDPEFLDLSSDALLEC
jgi:hypothetical protein